MPNHYHLLIRSPSSNLSNGMQYLNGTYTLWLNTRHRWDGPVFRGRFTSQLVEDEEYLRILLAYIHLNPIEANLARRLTDEAWTSHRVYLGKEQGHRWLSTEFFLDLLGGPKALHQFVMSVRRKKIAYPEDFSPETGLFKKRGLSRKSGREKECGLPEDHFRLRPVAEVLEEICRLTGTQESDLRSLEWGPRANPARRFAIWALNRSADITQKEIGGLLNVQYNQVTRLLGRMRKTVPEPLAGWIGEWISKEPW